MNINNTLLIESLAAEIGENIYLDIAKWHLYLADAHLHTIIAEKVYPLLEDNSLEEDAVEEILETILVEVGGGKMAIPLTKLLPKSCQQNLSDILEEFKGNL